MGIPSYFSHIVRSHRKIIKHFDKSYIINNLYLDCNSLIYDSFYEISQNNSNNPNHLNNQNIENNIITLVCNKILMLINLINPISNVFIAFDGVAPVAKLNQQRNRRYKSWFQQDFLNKYDDQQKSIPKWDTILITPGTIFMKNLTKKIHNFFNKKLCNKLNINIIISSSDIEGEGEHKIFEYIRNNQIIHYNTSTIIYGLDADLIMLTLNHLHICPNMFLFRETPYFIKSLDNTLNPNENYILDIPLLSNTLSFQLNNNLKPSTKQEENKIYDYIFLCFFLGNDFLPHFPSLNIRTKGIERLLDAYINIIGSKKLNLIKDKNIIWKNLRNLLIYLSNYETDYIKDEYKIRKNLKKTLKNKKGTIEEDLMIIPLKDTSVEDYINPFDSHWEYRYYKELFSIDITNEDNIKSICINYLEGLEWTLKYYSDDCIDWRWKYNYDYPPLLKHLVKYIPYFNTTFIEKKIKNPVSQYVQLAYVLPKNKLSLLPKKIFDLLSNKYSNLYSLDYHFKWAFCKYFWECHTVMPLIDIKLLEEICN